MTIRQAKRAMRGEVVARIARLGAEERADQQRALDTLIESLPGFHTSRTMLLYVSAFAEEIDTTGMIRRALDAGKRVVCPRVDREAKRLRLHVVADPDRELMAGTLGIPEPDSTLPEVHPLEVDWALVPGLAFDIRGYRLGRGGGFYDRLLPTLRDQAPRWALAFDVQWVEAVPIESHDQPLSGIATPALRVDCAS